METDNSDKVIIKNDLGYQITDWATIATVLTTLLIGLIFSFENLPTSVKVVLTVLAISCSLYIASYIFLYTVSFYAKKIDVNYTIGFPINRNKTIDIRTIKGLKYTYTGGRGSGGTGALKIYYAINGHNKVQRCRIDREDAAKIYKSMKDSDIVFEIKPSWVLNEYL